MYKNLHNLLWKSFTSQQGSRNYPDCEVGLDSLELINIKIAPIFVTFIGAYSSINLLANHRTYLCALGWRCQYFNNLFLIQILLEVIGGSLSYHWYPGLIQQFGNKYEIFLYWILIGDKSDIHENDNIGDENSNSIIVRSYLPVFHISDFRGWMQIYF